METTTKTAKTPKKKQKCKWIRYKYPSRPEIFEAFSIWMAHPPSAREPKTQGTFAIKNEVSPDTLSDYKKKPKFWEKVKENKEKLKREIEDSILLSKAFKELEKLEKES